MLTLGENPSSCSWGFCRRSTFQPSPSCCQPANAACDHGQAANTSVLELRLAQPLHLGKNCSLAVLSIQNISWKKAKMGQPARRSITDSDSMSWLPEPRWTAPKTPAQDPQREGCSAFGMKLKQTSTPTPHSPPEHVKGVGEAQGVELSLTTHQAAQVLWLGQEGHRLAAGGRTCHRPDREHRSANRSRRSVDMVWTRVAMQRCTRGVMSVLPVILQINSLTFTRSPF